MYRSKLRGIKPTIVGLKQLFSLQRFGIKPGLERTLHLLEFCGNPHKMLKLIHVAGTNGKGSVCSTLAAVLASSGYRVGLYTSPHILSFNERIKLVDRDSCSEITDTEIIELTEKLLPETLRIGGTFFEITTVMALQWFASKCVDVAVLETGMGGRFDSTNVVDPVLTIITQIGYDHTEYLGTTLESIAAEKAGIIKPGTATVVGQCPPVAEDIIAERARYAGSNIIFSEKLYRGEIDKILPDMTMQITIESENKFYNDLKYGLAGSHQLANAITSVGALDELAEHFTINEDALRQGFGLVKPMTRFIGRIDRLAAGPVTILDVSHNPSAVDALVNTLSICSLANKWNIVFAAMADKDIDSILGSLVSICSTLSLPQLEIDRSAKPTDILIKAKEFGFREISTFETTERAINSVLSKHEPILITGSFYLAGESLPCLIN